MKEHKLYRLYGIEMAVHLLRPNASWEITNDRFTRWDDPRPCPTMQEVFETMEKIRNFEDSIPTIWLEQQEKFFEQKAKEFDESFSY